MNEKLSDTSDTNADPGKPDPREEGTQLMLQFQKRGGLLPVVVQDVADGSILMLGYADNTALQKTRDSGLATFFSTSRGSYWTKGETSGDYLKVQDILVDCDQDALVYRVSMAGDGACHTKRRDGRSRKSCFYRYIVPNADELAFFPGSD
ncbi:MAG: phosphoribosyl-AMP cyclohydrolase [Spirochaeta sp.]